MKGLNIEFTLVFTHGNVIQEIQAEDYCMVFASKQGDNPRAIFFRINVPK